LVDNGGKRSIIEDMGKETSARNRALREIGKVSVNFGNLTFASLVLGTIITGNYDRLTLLLVGGGVALIFIVLGVVTLTITGGEQ
jgi:sorbitol-specific phosphotransferase system component IIA